MSETIQQVINRISARIKASRPDINVEPGSTLFDTFIDHMADEVVRLEIMNDYNSTTQSPDAIIETEQNTSYLDLIAYAKNTDRNAILLDLSDRLELLASNDNLTRNPALFASGFVQFTRDTDISPSDDFLINQGTKVSTDRGVEFVVTETIEVNQAINNLYPYVNSYAVTVPVKAVNAGVQGNQLEGKITTITGMVAGFTGVINDSALSGGANEETDSELASRIKLAKQGNNIGTRKGYEAWALSKGVVTDVLVLGANDPMMDRDNGYGGCVDIYILEEDLKQVTENIVVIDPSNIIPMLKQPVRSIVSPSTGLTLIKDNSVYAGSIEATDKVSVTGTPPTVPFDLTYIYNENVSKMQTMITDEDISMRDDVLIKEATKVLIDITMRIKIVPGNDINVVKGNITSTLINYIDSLKIGDTLESSDIVLLLTPNIGVDQTYLPFDIFNREDQINATPPVLTVNTVVIKANEYARLGELIISEI